MERNAKLKDSEAEIHLSDSALEEEIERKYPRLSGRTLTAVLAFVAGSGFTLFG